MITPHPRASSRRRPSAAGRGARRAAFPRRPVRRPSVLLLQHLEDRDDGPGSRRGPRRGSAPSGSPSPDSSIPACAARPSRNCEKSAGPSGVDEGLAARGASARVPVSARGGAPARGASAAGTTSSSSRGRPSGVKCLRSLTVKGFSVWLISGRRAVCGRPASGLPDLLHRSAAARSYHKWLSPQRMRRSSPSPAVRTHTPRPSVATSTVPSRSVRRTSAPDRRYRLEDLGVRVPERVVRPRGHDRQLRRGVRHEPVPAARSAPVVRHLQDERTRHPQGALRLPGDVAREQQVHLAEPHVEDHRVLVADGEGRTAGPRRSEHRDPDAVPVDPHPLGHRHASGAAHAQPSVDPAPDGVAQRRRPFPELRRRGRRAAGTALPRRGRGGRA